MPHIRLLDPMPVKYHWVLCAMTVKGTCDNFVKIVPFYTFQPLRMTEC